MDKNIMRLVPLLTIVGAIIGFIAYVNIWAFGVTGIDYLSSDLSGWEKFIPTVVVALCVVAIFAAILSMISPRYWYMTYVAMLMGIIILALTSLFSMWTIDETRSVHYVGNGFWLSYAAGAVIILAAAVQYAYMFRKPRDIESSRVIEV